MRGPLYRPGWRRVICVASGPSLADGKQKEIIRAAGPPWRVMVANSTWEDFPLADIVFGSDEKFWCRHHAAIAAGFPGERWTSDSAMAAAYGLRWIEQRRERDEATGLWGGLSRDPSYLRHGGNTGHALVALAHAFDGEPGQVIVLAGYDMQLSGGTVNPDGILVGGPVHHHGPHPAGMSNPQASALASWAERMRVTARDLAARGVIVLNATTQTALDCFPRVDLAATLAGYADTAPVAA